MDWTLAEAVIGHLVAQWQPGNGPGGGITRDVSSMFTSRPRIASVLSCNPITATNNAH